jgi:GTPase SAR1 family protein
LFDITSDESFKCIDKWMDEINMYAPPTMCKILLGNKRDLLDLRKVSFEEAYAKAKHNNMQYIEISAKTGENVEQAFHSLWTDIIHSPIVIPISPQELKKMESTKTVLKPEIAHKLAPYCS